MDRRVVGTIAMPLAHATLDSGVVTAALEAGMGVVLPGQAWRNQLPRDHPKRSGAFATLALHRPQIVLRPDDAMFGATFAERYAADHLDAELNGRASIATTPGHVLDHEGGAGRSNELLLARLTAEEFLARRAWAPAPGQPASARRALYATIVLQGQHAKVPAIIDRLVLDYAALEGISGYWIIAANCTQSGVQLAGYASLALRLQVATGRSAVCSGVGDTHLALLASGVAATCAGLHGMSFTFPPAPLPERDEEDDDESGLGVHVYHRAILGNVGQLGEKGEAARRAIFRNRPCGCGHHPANEPPEGKRATVRHNAWAVSADAGDVVELAVPAAERLLGARAQGASRLRAFLKLSNLKRGFVAVAPAAAAVRAADIASANEQS
jgi:hypothetical protein